MTTDHRAELQALLVRAADQEVRRQAARQRGDRDAEQAAEDEIRALWRRHAEIEERERVA